MEIDIISIFPDMFNALNYGIPNQAQKKKQLIVRSHQLRDYAENKQKTVDDRPFGGGAGMVMTVAPIRTALKAIKRFNPGKVVYLSPQGKTLDHASLKKITAEQSHLIFICGRYQGIDERLIQHDIDEEWSIGDYILSGGELAAMVVIDAISRLIPEVLGNDQSNQLDSFANGLLDYPHYTRPASIDGQKVPDLLLNGDHKEIENWRKKQSLLKTRLKKPELFNKISRLPNDQDN